MNRSNKERNAVLELQRPEPSRKQIIRVPKAWRRRVQRTSSLPESFYHALRGVSVAFQGERNLKIHSVMALAAISLALCLHIDALSWALLFLAIGLVVTAELLNTAIERAIDMFTGGEFHNLAKDAKDVAAGAVVCAAISSAAMGAAIFLPRIIALFQHG